MDRRSSFAVGVLVGAMVASLAWAKISEVMVRDERRAAIIDTLGVSEVKDIREMMKGRKRGDYVFLVGDDGSFSVMTVGARMEVASR